MSKTKEAKTKLKLKLIKLFIYIYIYNFIYIYLIYMLYLYICLYLEDSRFYAINFLACITHLSTLLYPYYFVISANATLVALSLNR